MRVVIAPSSQGALAAALEGIGVSRADCVRLIGTLQEDAESHRPIMEWKARLAQAGHGVDGDVLERLILGWVIDDALPRIDSLRLHEAVKKQLRKELEGFVKPAASSDARLEAGSYLFGVAAKMASFRRFPAGPMDWTVSGVPRSWLIKVPRRDLPRTLKFIAKDFGGFKPAIYTHVAAPPRKRTLVMEKEVRRGYYRMAKTLALQPEMLGIMTASWLNDPVMLREMPTLAAVNEPYIDHGGFITTVGPAHPLSGFLERSPERQKRYDAGELRPMVGLALWPRKAAIAWAEAHPELE